MTSPSLFDKEKPRLATVIVGATGGLGQEIARTFARHGAPLIITYNRNAALADTLTDEIRAAGGEIEAMQMGVTDYASVVSVLDAAAAAHGGIETVVYASGPKVKIAAIADQSIDDWREAIETDVVGFFTLCKAALPHLRESRGNIVALATAGTRRYPSLDILSAGPKASVEMLIKGIAREEGRNGVRANSIGVGTIDAGQTAELLSQPRFARLVDRVLQATPLKRLGTPEDIAGTALYLASPLAAYVTGQHICVDGGGSV